ncbi:uncharacterized protein LOC132340528 isoform X2 [Haemorhous mexicanus]|uniref:uncharacterized protein LOC132340528 isoform X2 n=1 Tax=Haemorhous mexicanus TaxID=30427 RepID=UPI0028BE02EF|nr:uncharacterized protein LOC132340528 isoform X2 [Haemorhous mexicanus]
MEPQEVSPAQLLEALVSVVATLGEVAATVTGSHQGVQQCLSPDSLRAALRRFTQSLRETLDHGSVPSLGQALATLRATSWISWADVRAVAKAWQRLVAALRDRWDQLALEAAELCVACADAAPARARDLWYETARRGTAWHRLAATAQRPTVALDWEEVAWVGATCNVLEAAATDEEEAATSEEEAATSEEEVATSEEEVATSMQELAPSEEEAAISEEELAPSEEELAPSEEEAAISEEELAPSEEELAPSEEELAPSEEEAATNKAMGEAVVAASQARAATRRGHWAEVALGPLERLVDVCDRATMFIRNMDYCLWEIRIILNRTKKASPNVPVALVAKVAEAEQLWEAGSHLAKEHLLGIFELIDNLLLSPCGGPGGPGGPCNRTVDEWCQEAIKDIPRLLQGQ